MNPVAWPAGGGEDELVSTAATGPSDDELVEAIITSPIGATALWALAYDDCFGPTGPGDRPPGPARRDAVGHAAERVAAMSRDALVVALAGTVASSSPFSGADDEVAARVRVAGELAEVARALVAAHRLVLTAPVDLDGQWCGFEGPRRGADIAMPPLSDKRRLFDDLSEIYECGEFPVRAWKTHDPVPDAAVDAVLAGDDSFLDEQSSLWRFPVVGAPVVHEVVMPHDWTQLLAGQALGHRAFRRIEELGSGFVIEHPSSDDGPATTLLQSHPRWDCTVLAVGDDGLATMRTADGRILDNVRGMAMPDWSALAARVDGVHFTWAGILTTEARIVQLRHGWLTTARHWGTPSTRWFRDVFGPAEPLPVPAVGAKPAGLPGADRLARDRLGLRHQFGPDSAVPGGK